MTESTEETATASQSTFPDSSESQSLLTRVQTAVYVLGSLLATSLLVVGTVAIIAEIKGTWHWAIHLESTISYMGLFIAALLALIIPLAAVLVVGRWWVDD